MDVEGTILFNGKELTKDIKRRIGFVTQVRPTSCILVLKDLMLKLEKLSVFSHNISFIVFYKVYLCI